MTAATTIIFWACAGLIVYSYAGYALLIWCAARWFGGRAAGPIATTGPTPEFAPLVTLLVAAHNEEAVIGERIENALLSDYLSERLQIVVGSDGSSDRTAEIARRFAPRVRLLDFPDRRGKATVLNDAIAQLNSEIVVLSDANTFFDPPAINRLTRWFADPAVGAVCGRLVLTDPSTGRNADSMYWKYETFLKRCEGRLGALLGSNGAIYAIRRSSYVPIPGDTIVDDFVIPLLAKLKTGCSIVYEERAIAREQTPAELSAEFHRRTRIGAGGFQSMALLWRLLDVRRGWVAITFFSHKVLRWLCPFFMIGAAGANVMLLRSPAYRFAAGAQALFYLASGIAAALPARVAVKPLRLAAMFTGMNAALFVGFFRWAMGRQRGTWRRTARAAGEGAGR